MKLYEYYRSSTSYRVRIALNLKNLEYESIGINLLEGEHKVDAYRALNPHMSLPALEFDGDILVQSLAILDWLESYKPTPSLLPADGAANQICRELYYAVATEIHAVNNSPVLTYLQKTFGADQAAIETWYGTWIQRTFAPVEARLDRLKWQSCDLPFGKPTRFEIVLIPQLYNARRWNTDLGPFPQLKRIDDYCLSLSAFAKAHPDVQPDAN